MLKGLRGPFVVLVLAVGLLVLALATRPKDTPGAAPQPETPTATAELPPQTPDVTAPPQAAPASSSEQPTPPPSVPDNILVEALVGQIHKLNPLLATYNPVDRDITALIFEGLTTTNEFGEIVPRLAQSWTVSADGLQYLVTLREDVLWQDGLPFTAHDVVFTTDLMSDPQFPGAADLHNFWKTVEVDALNDHLVRFRLTQPLASFTDQLRVGILPAHVFEGWPVARLGEHPSNLQYPIGTGPYQFEALTSSSGQIDGIQLRVAPVFRQRPEGAEGYLLDRIVFRTYPTAEAALDAYYRGEVNSLSFVPPALQASAAQAPGLSLYPAIAPRVGVLIYNWQRDSVRFVRNPRVRLALAHAVDRAGLVAQTLAGSAIPADSPLLPQSWAYEPGLAWPTYDLAQAQSILASANLELGAEDTATPEATEAPPDAAATEAAPTPTVNPDAPAPTSEGTEAAPSGTEPPPTEAPLRLALTILVLDDPGLVALAEGIAAGWQEIGFETGVEQVDAAGLQARLEAGDFDAAIVELSFEPSADPDPYVFWHQGQYGAGQNYGGMDDRRISETLEMARRDSTGLNRVAHYHRFQELFAERVPALVLYYPLYVYAADVRLKGVQIGFLSSPADRFRTVKDWRFTG